MMQTDPNPEVPVEPMESTVADVKTPATDGREADNIAEYGEPFEGNVA